MLGEVLWRPARTKRHLGRPPLRAHRPEVGRSGASSRDGIRSARLAQTAAVIARFLELAHAVVWYAQSVQWLAVQLGSAVVPVEPLESSDTVEPGLWASMLVPPVRIGGADIVNNTQLPASSTGPAPALSTALHLHLHLHVQCCPLGRLGARDGSPSVELGQQLRLCGHVECSERR